MNRIICGIAVVWVALCMAACADRESGAYSAESKSPAEIWSYEVEYVREEALTMPCQAVGDRTGAYIWLLGNTAPLCFYDFQSDGITYVDCGLDEGEYILAIAGNAGQMYLAITNGDKIWVCAGQKDASWESVAEFAGDMAGGFDSFWVDSQQNYYFVSGQQMWVIGQDKSRRSVDVGDQVAFWEDSDGVKCLTGDSEGLICLAMDEKGAEEIWTLDRECGFNLQILDSEGAQILLLADDTLFHVDKTSGEILAEADLVKSGINFRNICGGVLVQKDTADERLYLIGRSAGGQMAITRLMRRTDESARSREEIVYGTVYADSSLVEQIVRFNQTNEDYYITLRVYGDGDLELGQTQSGSEGPDLVNLYYVQNYDKYVTSGYLEDLTPYLQSMDSERRKNVMWQILEPYQTDGKLCILLPHFAISELILSPEDAAGLENWDMETMFALIEANAGRKSIFRAAASENLLSVALRGMQGNFIDYDAGVCYFDSREFVRLLEYCKEYGREPETGTRSVEEMAQNTLFLDMTFSSYMVYMSLLPGYAHGVPVYGYPSDAGQKYIADRTKDACGINVKSSHKEGAWEFMRMLLEPSYQEAEGMGWPICRDSYDNVLKQARGVSIFVHGEEYAVEEEDIAVFEDIVSNGIFQRGDMDPDIWKILSEETQAFWRGDRSAEDTAAIIQNRVGLVLEE